MFCAKTHNMGFVSPVDHKTPIVPLQGASLRDCRKRQERLRHKGELRPSLNPSASQNGKHFPCFSFRLCSACCVGCQIIVSNLRTQRREICRWQISNMAVGCRSPYCSILKISLNTSTETS